MTWTFWAVAALLLAGGLLFVLPPLLRPPVPAGAAPGAPAPRVPRGAALVVALALPAGALALYGLLGRPAALAPAAAQADAPHALSREQMQGMVERLAERMKQTPNDADGWHMLARSYVAFGRLPEAAQAYDRAVALSPRDPQILADYADTLAMVNGRNLEGKPMELVGAALELDPKHQKSLALAGTAAFNRRDFAQAVSWWKQLQAQLPQGSDQARSVAASIAQAQAQGGAAAAAPPAPPAPAAATGGSTVEGTVTLAESLRARLPAGATLFVFARPTTGSGMPLAIQRVPATALPYRFKLDDTLAMSPDRRLSAQGSVLLGARISKSGQAMPQSGDLLGTLGPVAVGSRDVKLVIDGVVP